MKLGKYYIDLNLCLGEDFSEYEFSPDGIPLTNFHRQPNWQHNPITICQYGLHHFNRYLRTEDVKSKEIFLTQANWLVDHAEPGAGDSFVWYYRFDLPLYKIKAPWISGMAQGQAISVLLRANQLTGEESYLKIAKSAWKSFHLLVEQGGVISNFPDGNPVVEEYPSPEFLTGVLNGFIFAIFGVYDFAHYFENENARQFFLKLIDSLKYNLHRYDCGYWSYYDLKSPLRLTSKAYHRIHIKQLNALYQISGEELFKTFEKKWQGYLYSTKCNLKWMARKIHQKVNSNWRQHGKNQA